MMRTVGEYSDRVIFWLESMAEIRCVVGVSVVDWAQGRQNDTAEKANRLCRQQEESVTRSMHR
jgi:hypothetical protein